MKGKTTRKQKPARYHYLPILVLVVFLAAGYWLFAQPKNDASEEHIYVANEGDGTISVIDEGTLKVVKTITLAGMPHNVNVDPLGRYVYATNHEGEEEEEDMMHHGHIPYLRIIDAKTFDLITSVPMEDMAAHVVPSRDGSVVYVSREGGSSIVEVDVEQGAITRTFATGPGPHGMVLSNDGGTIYAPNMQSNDVSVIDVQTGKEKKIALVFEGKTCETPVAMGITQDDQYSFVTCGTSFDVYKIDNKAKKVIGHLQLQKGLFPGPIQTPVHPEGKDLYVPNMRHGVVHNIDVASFALVKDIPTGEGSHGIAFSADGRRAYVTNTWENTVAVLDLTTDTIVKKIAVGEKPNGIAVSKGKNQGW